MFNKFIRALWINDNYSFILDNNVLAPKPYLIPVISLGYDNIKQSFLYVNFIISCNFVFV